MKHVTRINPDEEISLEFNDSSSPVIAIESSSPDLIYVLMPMRV